MWVFVSDLTEEGKWPPLDSIYKGGKTEPRRGSTETTAGPLSLFSEEMERRICYSLTGRPGRPEPGYESLAGQNL